MFKIKVLQGLFSGEACLLSCRWLPSGCVLSGLSSVCAGRKRACSGVSSSSFKNTSHFCQIMALPL